MERLYASDCIARSEPVWLWLVQEFGIQAPERDAIPSIDKVDQEARRIGRADTPFAASAESFPSIGPTRLLKRLRKLTDTGPK